MKVSELRELLKDIPDDFKVILAKDDKGKDFSPLSDTSDEMYVPRTTWSGNLQDGDDPDFRMNALVLWPMN